MTLELGLPLLQETFQGEKIKTKTRVQVKACERDIPSMFEYVEGIGKDTRGRFPPMALKYAQGANKFHQ